MISVMPDDQGQGPAFVVDPMDLDEGRPADNLNESDLAWYAAYYGLNDPGASTNNNTTISSGDPMDISNTPPSDQTPRRSPNNSRLRVPSLRGAARPIAQSLRRASAAAPATNVLGRSMAPQVNVATGTPRPRLGPVTNRYIPYQASPAGDAFPNRNRWLYETRDRGMRLHGGVIGRGGALFSTRTHTRHLDPFGYLAPSSIALSEEFDPPRRTPLVIDRSNLPERRRRFFGYDPDLPRPAPTLSSSDTTEGSSDAPGNPSSKAGGTRQNQASNPSSIPGTPPGPASTPTSTPSTVPLKRLTPDSDPQDIPGGFPHSPDSPTTLRRIAAKRSRTTGTPSAQAETPAPAVTGTTSTKSPQRGFRMPSPTPSLSPVKPQDDAATSTKGAAQAVTQITPAKRTRRGFRVPSPTPSPSPARAQDDCVASTQGAAQVDEDIRSPGSTSWTNTIHTRVANIVQSAITMAESFKRRALTVWARARIPEIRRRIPDWRRLNVRGLPEEARLRIRNHRWRRNRGQPANDPVLPFPELNVDLPQAPVAQTPLPAIVNTAAPANAVETAAEDRKETALELQQRYEAIDKSIKYNREKTDKMTDRARKMVEARRRYPFTPTSLQDFTRRQFRFSRTSRPLPQRFTPQKALATVKGKLPVIESPIERPVESPVEHVGHVEQPAEQHIERPAETIEPVDRPAEVPAEVLETENEYDAIRPPSPPLLGTAVSAVSLVSPNAGLIPLNRTPSRWTAEWRQLEKERISRERLERRTRTHLEGTAIRPISEEWEDRLDDAMRRAHSRHVATSLSGDPLTRKDLATCFTTASWLNDEIINCYLAMIVDHLRRSNDNAGRHDKPLFHAFNTFFFSNLRDKGYSAVRRWAGRAKVGGQDLLNVDTIFVPVHNSAHWTLIVVKPSDRTIENFDSLGSLSREHVELIKVWLKGELGKDYIDDEWEVLKSKSSQQDNGSDCGVFLLSNAKAVALNIDPMSYGASDIRMLRKKIVAEIINGGLEGDFAPSGHEGVRM